MKTYIVRQVSFKTRARRADYLSSSVETFRYVVSLHVVLKWRVMQWKSNAGTHKIDFEIWHLTVATAEGHLLLSLCGSK